MVDHAKLHKIQEEHMNSEVNNESRRDVHESWSDESTADFWRHKRMYELIRPLASKYKGDKWLSVGDGRYGLDSRRLHRLFELNVFPTDISESALKLARDQGHISEYKVENAENLSFADNSFDVVFCKETFHHCPRPIIALYEMVRVAKKVVILLEPNDKNVLAPPGIFIRQIFKIFINTLLPSKKRFSQNYSFFANYGNTYEECGNYVYAISRREVEKIVQGMNLHGMAWAGINDHYIKGCEFARAEPDNVIFKELLKVIDTKNKSCLKNPLFNDYGMLAIVIFKEWLEPDLRREMEDNNFHFSNTKRNPHIK